MSVELHPFDEIFRDERFRYWFRGEQLWSLSQILRWTGVKKTHAGIEPQVLEWAAERGKAVEGILFDFVRGEPAKIHVPAWTRKGTTLADDVRDRLPAIQSFMANERPDYVTHHQIVADLEAGIAGELDLVLRLNGCLTLTDVKCTSQIEKDWGLQLGMLVAGWEEKTGEKVQPAVLHFKQDLKKGYKLRTYDRNKCLQAWFVIKKAWMESKALFEEAREALKPLIS